MSIYTIYIYIYIVYSIYVYIYILIAKSNNEMTHDII